MNPAIIAIQARSEGSGIRATALEFDSNGKVLQRVLEFKADGTYTAGLAVQFENQYYGKQRLASELLYPSPLTRLLGVEKFLQPEEYREAFSLLDGLGAGTASTRRFNELIETGTAAKNLRGSLEICLIGDGQRVDIKALYKVTPR